METKEQEVKTPEVKEKKPRAPRKKKVTDGEEKPKAKRAPRKKKTTEEEIPAPAPTPEAITPAEIKAEPEAPAPTPEVKPEAPAPVPEVKPEAPVPSTSVEVTTKPVTTKPIPPCPTLLIRNIVDLINAPKQQLLLNDQQVQQLTLEEAEKRFRWIEGTLALVLNYDVVLSDTNIWIELLTGHTSSHSDPRYNARLQFERQLEFISRLTQYRGGRFMMMSETYEEIDRFATMQDPVSPKDADMTDEATCRNIAGRLAKRLILSQQRENRLRIEGITSESHHSAFADPAIIRRTVELFSQGKKVLLLTNDASVAIRAMGMCDDLQRTNDIDDDSWDEIYAPLRPMVMTFDDLKVLDAYTRQYHFLQQAAGKAWMEDVPQRMERRNIVPLFLWNEGFRPGDRYSEKKMQQMQQKQKPQPKPQQKEKEKEKEQPKAETPKPEEPKAEPQPVETPTAEAPKADAPKAEEPQKEKKPSRRGGRRSPRKKTQQQQ